MFNSIIGQGLSLVVEDLAFMEKPCRQMHGSRSRTFHSAYGGMGTVKIVMALNLEELILPENEKENSVNESYHTMC